MKIAVTGASGFIGRHVLQALARHGVEAVAATRDPSRLADLPATIARVQVDIANPAADDFTQLGRPDALIHLAWAGLPHYRSLHHFESELPLQYTFLRQLVSAGLRSVVVSGTCFEYGMQCGPLSEGTPTAPTNPYGFAKDTLRRQLTHLQSTHSFALTWARLFYMYGAGQPPTSLYPALKSAALRGDPIFPMSGGEQLRDYLPVEEVADKLVRLTMLQRDCGAVNVCSGIPTSVRSLVEAWIHKEGWEIALERGRFPYPDYEPMAFWGCRDRLDAMLADS